MAPRATQASQKATQSQAARGKRKGRRAVDDDDDDEEEEAGGVSEEEGGRGKKGGLSEEEIQRKANDLVRLALFVEPKRGALKRDDINKKVMGGNARMFNSVFAAAQEILRKTCGMELVELMTRMEKEKGLGGADDAGDENNMTGIKKKAASTSKTYILRSSLDAELIEIANSPDPDIYALAREELIYDPDDDDDDDGPREVPDSTLVAWGASDHPALIGITYVILALILVGGRALPDAQLRNQLRALNLPSGASIPTPRHSTQKSLTLDNILNHLHRQSYLDRFKTSFGGQSQAPAATQGKRRGRADDADREDANNSYEWKWGSRALAEIGEVAVVSFISQFMWDRRSDAGENAGDAEDEEEEEEEDSGRRSGRGKKGKKAAPPKKAPVNMKAQKKAFEENILRDITRAAGGELIEIKSKKAEAGA